MANRETFTIEILQKVADEGREEKFENLIETEREIDRVSAEKAMSNKRFGDTIKTLGTARRALMDAIESGVERAEVDVYTRVSDDGNEVKTYRCDNDEELTELARPLTAEERQLDFSEVSLPPGEPDLNVPGEDEGEESDEEDAAE